MTHDANGVASGLRALEIGSGPSAALAGMALADDGAEVVKVEPPGGDPARAHPAFRMWSRGKASLVADLATGAGRDRVAGLLRGADVAIVALKPAAAGRFGLDPAALERAYPRLVHCSITGFGRGGPHSQIPSYDGVVTARAGRMHELSPLRGGGRPVFAAVPIASYGAAMLALQGVYAALRARERSGRGARVETSLLQALTVYDIAHWLPGAPREVSAGDVPNLPYLPACTADGVWLQFAQLSPAQWAAFVRALGLESLRDDPRFARMPAVRDAGDARALRDRFLARVRERTWAEWRPIFERDRDLAVEPFRRPGEAMDHPQLRHNGDVIEVDDPGRGRSRQLGPLVRFDATPTRPGSASPDLGSLGDAGWRSEPAAPATRRGPAGGAPFAGVTVLELATWIATPLAATLLADLGARVIKLEPPGGEAFRGYGRAWLKTFQGKESLVIDLKRPEARAIVRALAARADVLVHNYRPGVPERLGIDYATLRAHNPGLVYLYGASYGSTGPCSGKPAYHPTAGAVCGQALAQAGRGFQQPEAGALDAGELARRSFQLQVANEYNPDPSAGLASAAALAMALFARERTGRGQALETRMLCSNAYALSADFVDYEGRPPRESADPDLLGTGALYRLYRARDGWVFLAAPTQRDFERLARALGRSEWLGDPRFASAEGRARHDAALAAALEAALAERDAEHWESSLGGAGVACVRAAGAPVARFALDSRWARESGRAVDVEGAGVGRYARYGPAVTLSRDPAPLRGPAPAGAHTRAILSELGFPEAEIDALEREGVVSSPETGGATRSAGSGSARRGG